MAKLDRKEYFINYNKKREKKIHTRHLSGKRESDDVWNIQRKGQCFSYDKLMIAFLTQNFKILL